MIYAIQLCLQIYYLMKWWSVTYTQLISSFLSLFSAEVDYSTSCITSFSVTAWTYLSLLFGIYLFHIRPRLCKYIHIYIYIYIRTLNPFAFLSFNKNKFISFFFAKSLLVILLQLYIYISYFYNFFIIYIVLCLL